MSDTVFFDKGHADSDVSELEVELTHVVSRWVGVGGDERVCSHDLFDFTIDEIVERIDMLLDKTSNPEEGWHQFPFILNNKVTVKISYLDGF